ncbi:MAG: GNAT family N-acetyltransferase [Flavobacteriales bacterium]|nr:GNAT family N-acetyltransferase [Flavobacteriales bacterium]
MDILKGENIYLRALEPEDLDFLFAIENDENLWEVSGTQMPFSKFILKQYLEQAHLDIYQAKQLRLVISKKNEDLPIGLIDLFDFDPQHKRAGIGIVITENNQGQGFAKDALETLIKYCFSTLQLHQIYANILEDNHKSISLFTQQGFEKVGLKKDWVSYQNTFKNEVLFQLINK